MDCTATAKKEPIPKAAVVIAAITRAPAPEGGWGDVKIIVKRVGPSALIRFPNRKAADHLKELIRFGSANYHAFPDNHYGSELRIKKKRLKDLVAKLKRKAGSDEPITAIAAPTDTPELEECGKIIDAAKAETVQCVFRIGKALQTAHDLLANHGDGAFTKWVQDRCGFSIRTAHNYLAVCKAFDEKDSASLAETATAEALYFLSREAVPEEATAEAVTLANQGERINLAKAKEIAEKFTSDDPANDQADEHFENACKLAIEFTELCKARMQESDVSLTELIEIAKQCGEIAQSIHVVSLKYQRTAGTLLAEFKIAEAAPCE